MFCFVFGIFLQIEIEKLKSWQLSVFTLHSGTLDASCEIRALERFSSMSWKAISWRSRLWKAAKRRRLVSRAPAMPSE